MTNLFPTLHRLPGQEQFPDQTAFSLQSGLMVCAAINAAVSLGLPERIDGPISIQDLARETGFHTRSLYLLLRALDGIGIFKEVDKEKHIFAHTDSSRSLRADSMGAIIRLWGADYQWFVWKNLEYTIRTGKPAISQIYGNEATIWEYLRENPDEMHTFQTGLAAVSNLLLPAIVAAYDFSNVKRLVDVGGGYGSLSAFLVKHYEHLVATVFDREAVIEQAQFPQEHAQRISYIGGDFFKLIPPGGDCYVLKNVLMDWADDKYLLILKNCRAAMSETSRLLVIEPVMSDNAPFTNFFSLQMTAMQHEAHHRTLQEHTHLFAQSGFHLTQVYPLGLEQMLLEGKIVAEKEGQA